MASLDTYTQTVLTTAENYKNLTLHYADKADDILSSFTNFGMGYPSYLGKLKFIGEDTDLATDERFKDVVDLRNEFDNKYNSLFNTLKALVPTELNKFINEYFPKPSNFDSLEQFLVDSVSNGSVGLPPEVERQIWQRDRERIDLANQKTIMETRKSVSSRGHMLPTGVESYLELLAYNEASKNVSKASTDVAIETAKMKIEWIKFAISEAKNYRALALESAFKYLSSILASSDPAFKYASGYVDSYKTFYDTLDRYLSSVNNINRLKFEKANAIDSLGLEHDKLWWSKESTTKQLKQSTALELMKTMGQNSQAAISAINTIASEIRQV